MTQKWTWDNPTTALSFNLALWDGEKGTPIVFKFKTRIDADRFIKRNNITITYR